MTVNDLIRVLDLTVYHLEDGAGELRGVYCGDMLSRVLGRASRGNVWLTVMSSSSVAMVAGLVGLSAVILTEGVQPHPKLLEQASFQHINLLGCAEDTWLEALRLHALFQAER